MLLASAMTLGVTVPSHADAIERICANWTNGAAAPQGGRGGRGMISPAEWQAEDDLAGCIADADQWSQLGYVSLCHGWAGLIQTTRRAVSDAGPDSALAALLPHLHTRFEQQLHRQRWPTCDGLLEGAAGIALTRHTTADTPASRWDACLLLAPPQS
ncbi:MAG: hypothetical protein ACRDT0_22965 [Pseudonocardiaceae bacterium]